MLNIEQIKTNINLISPESEEIISYFISKTIKYLKNYIEELTEEHEDLVEELTYYNIEIWKQAGVAQETLSERKIVYKDIIMSDLLIYLLKKYNIPLVQDESKEEEGMIVGW